MLKHRDSYAQRSLRSLRTFRASSAVDPVELFSSVTFLKDLFVECFHIQKIMFGFFFVVVKSKNKENKSWI